MKKIDKKQAGRILLTIIEKLTKNPTQFDFLKYKLKGLRKLRVGDYRVLYTIADKLVIIVKIGHRREIYD